MIAATLPDLIAWAEGHHREATTMAKCGRMERWPAEAIERQETRARMFGAVVEKVEASR